MKSNDKHTYPISDSSPLGDRLAKSRAALKIAVALATPPGTTKIGCTYFPAVQMRVRLWDLFARVWRLIATTQLTVCECKCIDRENTKNGLRFYALRFHTWIITSNARMATKNSHTHKHSKYLPVLTHQMHKMAVNADHKLPNCTLVSPIPCKNGRKWSEHVKRPNHTLDLSH